MFALVFLFLFFMAQTAIADTIDHFMNIANQIPKMEMKADPQAQAWAKSARDVLIIASESIAETFIQSNEYSKKQGHPLFCLPAGVQLSASEMNELIQQTYKDLPEEQKTNNRMTVSQIAWLGINKAYPCSTTETGAQNSTEQWLQRHTVSQSSVEAERSPAG